MRFVFIGVESINPDNLKEIAKGQNRADRFDEMFRAWRAAGIHVQAGYILGFARDTPASIARDVAQLVDGIGFDDVNFMCLTPLPGSFDHRDAVHQHAWLDPDLNRYALHRPVSRHPRMTQAQWRRAYRRAWRLLLNPRRLPGYLRRAAADGLDTRLIVARMIGYRLAIFIHDLQPYEYGRGRRWVRNQRRPDRPLEPPWRFNLRVWFAEAAERLYGGYWRWRIDRIARRTLGIEPP